MDSSKKQYSANEKAKVAAEMLAGHLTTAQISSKYKVHATQINSWRKQALEAMLASFDGNKKDKADQSKDELINELYQQIGQLTVERDWLKKKSTLFKS